MEGAKDRLRPLVRAGLNELNFSTGDDHASFVELQTVTRGLAAATTLGLTTVLMIEQGPGRIVDKATVLDHARDFPKLRQRMENGAVHVIESPWVGFNGNSVAQEPGALVNARNLPLRDPCSSILTTFVVTPHDRLGLCCGLPREEIPHLNRGNLLRDRVADVVEEAFSDFLSLWLFVEGPEHILAWAAGKLPEIEWEDLYAHNCDACRAVFTDPRVMQVIADHYEEVYQEVMAKVGVYAALQP
tara:strand:- start:3086 stop:3817 length:732 start_codon:yes stop_codon:yes gene_type:complete